MVLFEEIAVNSCFVHGGIIYKKIPRQHDPEFGTYNAIDADGNKQFFSNKELIYVC